MVSLSWSGAARNAAGLHQGIVRFERQVYWGWRPDGESVAYFTTVPYISLSG
jgi:hypothetical protein